MIAALFVKAGGCYFGLPDVDPWDEARDARKYAGPHPVICHSPCPRWGKMWFGQPLWVKRTGERKKLGDDGGCFQAAWDAVHKWGGVIEHPWESKAWPAFGIAVPPREGGWVSASMFDGGWTCCVEQGRYGHYARKPTLLYVYGCDTPPLLWGISEPSYPPEAIERHGLAYCKKAGELAFKGGGTDSAPRIGTPLPFRDLLLSIARTADVSGVRNELDPEIVPSQRAACSTNQRRFRFQQIRGSPYRRFVSIWIATRASMFAAILTVTFTLLWVAVGMRH